MRTKWYRPFLIILLLSGCLSSQIKRSRNEGTFNIPASNVLGNGNIIAAASFAGQYSSSGIRLDPGGYLSVGIADILQLSGKTSITNFRTIGSTEAHLQLTLPGNDHLRFFGASISGDLYLSTEIDTLSGSASVGRPEFNAYIRPSLIADLDWIAINKKLPLKTYLMAGMVDNPDLLYLYSQLSIRLGFEWKLISNSYMVDFGTGLYKEMRREKSNFPGDASYRQQRFWIEPAVRYRLFKRISLRGAVRVLLLQRVKSERPLEPTYVRLTTAAEIPLLYKETNTEAIRTMIFVEKEKEEKMDAVAASIQQGTKLETNLEVNIEGLDLDEFSSESEKEVLQRREEIQKKMEELERLLEDLDDE
jgi:hypothetical protein